MRATPQRQTIDDIDPGKLYSLPQAARLVPSPYPDKQGINPETLYRWRIQKRMSCVCRKVGTKRFWFVWGSELLRAMGVTSPPPVFRGRTRGQRERDVAAATETAKRQGLIDE